MTRERGVLDNNGALRGLFFAGFNFRVPSTTFGSPRNHELGAEFWSLGQVPKALIMLRRCLRIDLSIRARSYGGEQERKNNGRVNGKLMGV